MRLPPDIAKNLRLPLISAPMFLVSQLHPEGFCGVDPDGGVLLSQRKYAEALKPISISASEAEPSKARDAAGVTKLRGGIGA